MQTIKAGDKYRIIVELPGVKDTDQAISLLGRTANLNFREQLVLNIPNVGTEAANRIYFNPDSKLKGADIKKATVTFDTNTGKPQVALSFSKKGAQIFAEMTTKNLSKPIGIFLDDDLITAPTVQQPILDGNAVITGEYTVDGARQLAVAINSGALPVPIKLIEQRTIGPTLGAAEIQKSVYAGIIGLVAATFMILNYRGLGLIACAGLIIMD